MKRMCLHGARCHGGLEVYFITYLDRDCCSPTPCRCEAFKFSSTFSRVIMGCYIGPMPLQIVFPAVGDRAGPRTLASVVSGGRLHSLPFSVRCHDEAAFPDRRAGGAFPISTALSRWMLPRRRGRPGSTMPAHAWPHHSDPGATLILWLAPFFLFAMDLFAGCECGSGTIATSPAHAGVSEAGAIAAALGRPRKNPSHPVEAILSAVRCGPWRHVFLLRRAWSCSFWYPKYKARGVTLKKWASRQPATGGRVIGDSGRQCSRI